MGEGDLVQAVRFLIETGVAYELAEVLAGVPTRDRLAAMAMQGLCADPNVGHGHGTPEALAADAYRIADAMLVERERGGHRG